MNCTGWNRHEPQTTMSRTAVSFQQLEQRMLAQASDFQNKGEHHDAGEAFGGPEGGIGGEHEERLPGGIEDEGGDGPEKRGGEHPGEHSDRKRSHGGDAPLVG